VSLLLAAPVLVAALVAADAAPTFSLLFTHNREGAIDPCS